MSKNVKYWRAKYFIAPVFLGLISLVLGFGGAVVPAQVTLMVAMAFLVERAFLMMCLGDYWRSDEQSSGTDRQNPPLA